MTCAIGTIQYLLPKHLTDPNGDKEAKGKLPEWDPMGWAPPRIPKYPQLLCCTPEFACKKKPAKRCCRRCGIDTVGYLLSSPGKLPHDISLSIKGGHNCGDEEGSGRTDQGGNFLGISGKGWDLGILADRPDLQE